MKRIVLSAFVFSLLAGTTLQGQAAPKNAPAVSPGLFTHVDWKKPSRHSNKRVVAKKKHLTVSKPRWKRGQRYSNWRHQSRIQDYRRYGLKHPGRGQTWVRIGNDYLLVSIASGIIGAVIASR